MKHRLTLPILLLSLHLSGCMTPPPGLDLSLSKATVQHKYRVTIQPVPPGIAINQMHAWHVQVTSPAGEPVLPASGPIAMRSRRSARNCASS